MLCVVVVVMMKEKSDIILEELLYIKVGDCYCDMTPKGRNIGTRGDVHCSTTTG
jgi:hypothetical protein